MKLEFTLNNLQDTAAAFWEVVGREKVIAFHAPMGAGKTTFIHALCIEKKVKDPVTSPTFSIINEYRGDAGTIFHMDLYRLKDEEEAIQAGVEECLYSGELCLVEWPEKAGGLLPEDTVHAYIDIIDEQTRRIIVDDN